MTLLTNEERLLRARWKTQQEDRKLGKHKTLLAANSNRKCGRREYSERIISAHAMRFAERIFWQKRGYDVPPTTAAGVLGGTR